MMLEKLLKNTNTENSQTKYSYLIKGIVKRRYKDHKKCWRIIDMFNEVSFLK